jgi:hypothetical protein
MDYRCLPCLNGLHGGCSRYPCTCECKTSRQPGLTIPAGDPTHTSP